MFENKISNITFVSEDPSSSFESRSGVSFSRTLNKQKWLATVTWVQMKNAAARELFADLAAMRGMHGSNEISIPLINKHENVSGTITVDSAVAAGKTQVSVVGYVGELSKGGTFNFEGQTKLYMVLSHSANMVTFVPPLRKAVDIDTVINYTAPTMKVKLSSDQASWAQVRKNSQLSTDFEEVLE